MVQLPPIMSLRDIVMGEGAGVLHFGEHPVTREKLDAINALTNFDMQQPHYERIKTGDRGDAHDMWKLALRTDILGIEDHLPNIVNQIVPIIGSEEMFSIYREVDPLARTLRKIQINLLEQGGVIGNHIDRGSNPQWLMVCVLQLSKQYLGGEYVIVHPTDGEKKFKPTYGSLLIARTDVKHWINPVTAGIRKTLVYFVGMDSEPNYNGPMLVKPSGN